MSRNVIKSVLYFLVCTSTSTMYGCLYYSVDGVYVVTISVIFRCFKLASWFNERTLYGSRNKLWKHYLIRLMFMTECWVCAVCAGGDRARIRLVQLLRTLDIC